MVHTADPAMFEDGAQAVLATTYGYPDGFRIEPHSHPRAQLVYADSGVMTVVTQHGSWVVPPSRAVWVPAGVAHEVWMRGGVFMRNLYVDGAARRHLPARCGAMGVSALLKALIGEAGELPVAYGGNGRAERIMQLILDELRPAAVAAINVPVPAHHRLQAACAAILSDPGGRMGIDEAAALSGMSRRPFTGLFREAAGMSFSRWSQAVRLRAALPRLAAGHSVTVVALDLGYESPSAFAAMFRRVLGTTPSAYFEDPG